MKLKNSMKIQYISLASLLISFAVVGLLDIVNPSLFLADISPSVGQIPIITSPDNFCSAVQFGRTEADVRSKIQTVKNLRDKCLNDEALYCNTKGTGSLVVPLPEWRDLMCPVVVRQTPPSPTTTPATAWQASIDKCDFKCYYPNVGVNVVNNASGPGIVVTEVGSDTRSGKTGTPWRTFDSNGICDVSAYGANATEADTRLKTYEENCIQRKRDACTIAGTTLYDGITPVRRRFTPILPNPVVGCDPVKNLGTNAVLGGIGREQVCRWTCEDPNHATPPNPQPAPPVVGGGGGNNPPTPPVGGGGGGRNQPPQPPCIHPAITSLTPATGLHIASRNIRINGTDFTASSTVYVTVIGQTANQQACNNYCGGALAAGVKSFNGGICTCNPQLKPSNSPNATSINFTLNGVLSQAVGTRIITVRNTSCQNTPTIPNYSNDARFIVQ